MLLSVRAFITISSLQLEYILCNVFVYWQRTLLYILLNNYQITDNINIYK